MNVLSASSPERTAATDGGDVVSVVPSAMNALEAMMWRAEVDPRLRSPITVVDLLDREPDWERVVAAHASALESVPRLRQRVLEPWWGWGTPEWVLDPNFTLGFHLRRQRLPGDGGMRELLDLAALWATTPFDRVRPPWEAMLVTGLAGGGAAYLLKVHHSLVDGLGLVQVLDLLHGTTRDDVSDRHPEPVPDAGWNTRGELTAARTLDRARDVLPALRDGVTTTAGWLARGVTRPATSLARVGALVGSAARAAAPEQGAGSGLLRGRSLNRRFLALDVDLVELKRAAHAAGGSLNDAYVAAVLGALRHYHLRFGDVPDTVPAGMPVNTRTSSDPLGGNHWAGTRFAAPLGEADPAARVRHVRRIVATVTDEPMMDGLGLVAPLLAALPSPLLARIQGGATRANDLQVSNLPGLTRPAFLADAKIVRSYPFAPLPGGALMIALMSHQDTCCIAATLDPAAVTDPDLFAECLDVGFAEILALAP